MLLANFILEKIFQKYMSPEDLEAENGTEHGIFQLRTVIIQM